ncbi:MAG TPA: hypothetical protein VMV23_06380 [Candidatus Nanopelagicaceae bacterium]|nr:hypothetical protein [Candidatus Nanopelagicaceae bacterium]
MAASGAPAVARGAGRELVLVVPRRVALPDGSWHGIRRGGVTRLLEAIAVAGEFRPRSEVESRPEWQQVIPHLVVRSEDRVLAMRRLQAGSERRLRGQVTLGVGGHINADDGALDQAFIRGARREWAEEVVCGRDLMGRAVGLIKDDAGEVGRVHLGVLIEVDAAGAAVAVREHDKLEGRMTALSDLGVFYLEMETWSQFVYDSILAGALDDIGSEAVDVSLPAGGPGPG